MSWIQNDELFIKELTTGNKWANYVAEHLNDSEIDCYSPKMVIRNSIDQISEFSENDKDIIFNRMSGNLEVKSRNLNFSSDPSSYPYGTAFVDTVNGWNSKKEKPLAVILVSQKTSEMLVAPVSTENLWSTTSLYDNVRGIHDTWIIIEKNLLRPMEELISWLKTRQS
jgi:hypothetical protein